MKNNKGYGVIIVLVFLALVALVYVSYNIGKNSYHPAENTAPAIPIIPNQNTQDVQNITSISMMLPTPYISAQQNWPPAVQKLPNTAYSCAVGRTGMGIPLTTTEKTINARTYCITVGDEGTAGSIYYTYTYTTPSFSSSGTETTNFTLRYLNCGVYDEPQQTECNTAQSGFNLDAVVNSLM